MRSRFQTNARHKKAPRKSPPIATQYDPSRTGPIYRRWERELARAFAGLRLELIDLVEKDDAFGLGPHPEGVPVPVTRDARLLDDPAREGGESLLGNVFCPTGSGGGVDPSCSSGGSALPHFPPGSQYEADLYVIENAILRDALGRFAKTAGGGVRRAGHIAVGKTVDVVKGGVAAGKVLYEKVSDRVKAETALVEKGYRKAAPERLQRVLGVAHDVYKAIEKPLDAGYHLAQKAALAVAKEKGLPPERVERLGHVLGMVDGAMRWTANVPLAHEAIHALSHVGGPVAFLGAKAAFFVPVGSLAYVASAAVTNPAATIRAARAGVRKLLGKGEASSTARATSPAQRSRKEPVRPQYRPQLEPLGNVFCPTGPGGGVDATCSPGGKTMYRGVGQGADTTSGFEWYSETPALAGRYADFRGGKVETALVDAQRPFEARNPKAVQTARSFFAEATKQADLKKADKTKVLQARDKFNEHFGESARELVDYWSSPEAKERTRDLLEALGFDSINMIEGGEKTTAMLRKKPVGNSSVYFLPGEPTVNLSADESRQIFDACEAYGWDPWYEALLVAAADETGGDLDRALAVADRAWKEEQRPALNVFCRTGPGGGVKPDCSPLDAPVPRFDEKGHYPIFHVTGDHHLHSIIKRGLGETERFDPIKGTTSLKEKSVVSWTRDPHYDVRGEGNVRVVVKDKQNLGQSTSPFVAMLAKDAQSDEMVPGHKEHEERSIGVIPLDKIDRIEVAPSVKQRYEKARALYAEGLETAIRDAATAEPGSRKHKMALRQQETSQRLMAEYDEILNHPKVVFLPFSSRTRGVVNSVLPYSLPGGPAANAADMGWRFRTDPEKIRLFGVWLRQTIGKRLRGATEDQLWQEFIKEGFKRGAGRAFDDTAAQRRREAAEETEGAAGQTIGPSLGDVEARFAAAYRGGKSQFLRDSFAHPISRERLEYLVGRVYTDLDGVTEQMATSMQRILADGLVRGQSPREVAKTLSSSLDLNKGRALTIARTELVRAQAEGQLTGLENLGVDEVGVQVEWTVTKRLDGTTDPNVCALCRPLDGVVLKISEARGMLPRHPSCRCAFRPAGLGEDPTGQKRTKARIVKAIQASRAAERRKGEPAAALEVGGEWGPAEAISKTRPQSVVENLSMIPSPPLSQAEADLSTIGSYLAAMEVLRNAFCPTGKDGGRDNSCGRGGEKGGHPTTSFSDMNDALRHPAVDKFLEHFGESEFHDARRTEIGAALTDEHRKRIVASGDHLQAAISYEVHSSGGATIHQLGSLEKGGGRSLVESLQAEHAQLTARTVREEARGFYEKMGFKAGGPQKHDMTWTRPSQATGSSHAPLGKEEVGLGGFKKGSRAEALYRSLRERGVGAPVALKRAKKIDVQNSSDHSTSWEDDYGSSMVVNAVPEGAELGKPFRTPNGPKKFAVYVAGPSGKPVVVRFGDPDMEIKRDDPERRRNFRARHGCDDPGPKWKARYWACRFWSSPSVGELLGNEKTENAFCPTGPGGGQDNSCGRQPGAGSHPTVAPAISPREKYAGQTVGAAEHAHAARVARDLAQKLGGVTEDQTVDAGQKDKKPYDVKVPKASGVGDHDIEVKSLLKGAKQDISVHPDALLRKVRHQQANPDNTFHTVVRDERATYEGGAYAENYSGHHLYYRRGSGRWSLGSMHKVKDEAELKALLDTPASKLPKAARGSLPPPPPLKKLKDQAGKAYADRTARDKARKDRNREKLAEQARARRMARKAERAGTTENVFCKTGEGGGVRPDCKKGESRDGDSYFSQEALARAEKENQNKRSRERLIHMAPDDFLKMAERIDSPSPSKQETVSKVLKAGEKFSDLPFLAFTHDGNGRAQVVSHEGRHRAMALIERGVTSMPVIISSQGGGGGAEIRWGSQNPGNYNQIKGSWPTHLRGESGGSIQFPISDQRG